MRGPWFSGAIGSAATVERVAALVRGRSPVVVPSALWLAELLARVTPVVLLIEPAGASRARRAMERAARKDGTLAAAVAGEEPPIAEGAIDAIVVDALVELDPGDARALVASLADLLRPGGLLVALDGTREARAEATIVDAFLAAALVAVGQERPREGAVLTLGTAPDARVAGARRDGAGLAPR